jgi:MraZ protein
MLREYASLEKDCIVIGAMNRIEIWDAAAWQTYSDQQEQAFADLSDEVFPGV